jgi:hypothetical protein
LLTIWRSLTSTARGLRVVHDNERKQSPCQRTPTILGLPK